MFLVPSVEGKVKLESYQEVMKHGWNNVPDRRCRLNLQNSCDVIAFSPDVSAKDNLENERSNNKTYTNVGIRATYLIFCLGRYLRIES